MNIRDYSKQNVVCESTQVDCKSLLSGNLCSPSSTNVALQSIDTVSRCCSERISGRPVSFSCADLRHSKDGGQNKALTLKLLSDNGIDCGSSDCDTGINNKIVAVDPRQLSGVIENGYGTQKQGFIQPKASNIDSPTSLNPSPAPSDMSCSKPLDDALFVSSSYIPTGAPGRPPASQLVCQEPNPRYTFTVRVPGKGTMTLGRWAGGLTPEEMSGGSHITFFVKADFPVLSDGSALSIVDNLILKQYVINIARWYKTEPELFKNRLSDAGLREVYSLLTERYYQSWTARYLGKTDPVPAALRYAEVPDPRFDIENIPYSISYVIRTNTIILQAIRDGSIDCYASLPDIFPQDILYIFRNFINHVATYQGIETGYSPGICVIIGAG